MNSDSKKVVKSSLVLSLIVLFAISITIGVVMQDHSFMNGGKYARLYFNSGTIVEIDNSNKTLLMTVEDTNRDHIHKEFLEISYAKKVDFKIDQNNLAEGINIKVGYLQPITNYPVNAMTIDAAS